MREGAPRDTFLGIKLVPMGKGGEALCFVCTHDRPFLLSKVAGIFTIHDCHILEADINIRNGIVNDLYKIRFPKKYDVPSLENKLFEKLHAVLKGDTNIEKEIFLWEKRHDVIRDRIAPKFRKIDGKECVLTVNTSNKKGLLHKISWALSLAGMDINKAIISATEDTKAEDIFWISQRYGEEVSPEYQEKILDLLKIVVDEGQDPVEQAFKKEITMIYRQQLRRRGSGFRTAQLYADAHLRLIEGLFNRTLEQLNIETEPILIGVYGGIGSGAIGFTSDIDFIFLYGGEWREEYHKLKQIFKREFERICDLDLDESFLPYHINYFYLGKYEGDSPVSFDDFFGYIHYIDELRNRTENRLFEPQFFHYPWAFSIRFVGNKHALESFDNQVIKSFPRVKGKGYPSIKAFILGKKREDIRMDYTNYLKGRYFPTDLRFFETENLKALYHKSAYEEFIENIIPYDAIKYVFRRGIFPLLHIIHHRRPRTDMGLLDREYRHMRPPIDFMLKAFNVRKTLNIMGKWDLNYFLYTMDCKNGKAFCERYLRYQKEITDFVSTLIH